MTLAPHATTGYAYDAECDIQLTEEEIATLAAYELAPPEQTHPF